MLRRRGMRRIDQAQQRATSTELDLIFVEELCGSRDALTIYQRAVEALQINNFKLSLSPSTFRMTTRHHGGGSVDDYVAFGIAAKPEYLFVEIIPPHVW